MAFTTPSRLIAQADLLPLDHPAISVLQRIYQYGGIQSLPIEHLPISRRAALEYLQEAGADSTLSKRMREQAEWNIRELRADAGITKRSVVIPVSNTQRTVFDKPQFSEPFTGIGYYDTGTGSTIFLDPVLEAEFRYDGERSSSATILQGGLRLRGMLFNHVGFSGKATNGTIVGNDTVLRVDPRYGRSLKFGLLGAQRDIDFGSAHFRADFKGVALEIGREPLQLGVSGRQSLLLGAELPSNTDYIRLQANVGKVAFSHIHASLLDDTLGNAIGAGAQIPSKYIATHLLSVGPFGGVRLSLGEAIIYSRRPFEIGYLNPLNFIKSQEHYLRDRDNSLMYATLSATLPYGLFLEGEFLLDDLIFSRIGEGFWGNKTAWRLGGKVVTDIVDLGVSYTRLEPYVYSHVSGINAYIHDGAILAASGLEPNSFLFEGELEFWPIPNAQATLSLGYGEHGANVVRDGQIVRNVGGDIRRTFDSFSAEIVEFLDGDLETSTTIDLRVDYEFLRNMYVRLRGSYREFDRENVGSEQETQVWVGLGIGPQ